MSKITFRADEELVDRLERFDASKSEVMRQALRTYLDEHGGDPGDVREPAGSLDALVAERVDAILVERLEEVTGSQDLDLTISLVGAEDAVVHEGAPRRASAVTSETAGPDSSARDPATPTLDADESECGQCGSTVAASHVYCPNCGEKATQRVFCDCGDELRSDWAFCPSCGRRTPAADVLDGP